MRDGDTTQPRRNALLSSSRAQRQQKCRSEEISPARVTNFFAPAGTNVNTTDLLLYLFPFISPSNSIDLTKGILLPLQLTKRPETTSPTALDQISDEEE